MLFYVDHQVDNETDLSSEVEHDIDSFCHHQFILDEEIGIICKNCSFVDLEIKYCVAPFVSFLFLYSSCIYAS